MGVSQVTDHLAACGYVTVPSPDDASADAVLVWTDRPLAAERLEVLLGGARAQRLLLLAGPTVAASADVAALTEAAGIIPAGRTPVHETRLRPGHEGAAVTARFDG